MHQRLSVLENIVSNHIRDCSSQRQRLDKFMDETKQHRETLLARMDSGFAAIYSLAWRVVFLLLGIIGSGLVMVGGKFFAKIFGV